MAAAAAKSLQSCPTLCSPIDGSPPGSSTHGIFQARALERVASAFSELCVDSFTKLPWQVCCLCFGCAGSSLRHEDFSGCGPRASLPCGTWDLSFPTRDQTGVPCIGRQVPKHWAIREVQVLLPFPQLCLRKAGRIGLGGGKGIHFSPEAQHRTL